MTALACPNPQVNASWIRRQSNITFDVFLYLVDHTEVLGFYTSFGPIQRNTGHSRAEVRRACRLLARRGLAEYSSALWTDDGQLAGAGYAITAAGCAAMTELVERDRRLTAARAESEATMSEPLSVAELEELRAQDERQIDALRAALAQHSDANDVSNSDVQLLRLSVESLMGSQREKQP